MNFGLNFVENVQFNHCSNC